jgi:mRNA-degrading endonuclease RelE of RelBE toxin-antitoxin system
MACTSKTYRGNMRTVAETPMFQKYAKDVWTEAERVDFISWIALNPEAGDVIPGSGGCRKIRWAKAGRGKRGGVRVIYFNVEDEVIWLLIVYSKAAYDSLPVAFLEELKQGVEDA